MALPADCTGCEPAWRYVGGGYVERGRVSCAEGLSGRTVRIAGLELASNDVLARVQRADGASQTGVPEDAVNAAIALSIVFVAVEALKLRRGQGGITARWPWLVAFGFGLLHGLGFASALTALGLPPADVPAALLFFDVGVELGQLAFVLLALALAWSLRTLSARPVPAVQMAGIYAVGAVAGFWLIQRMTILISV